MSGDPDRDRRMLDIVRSLLPGEVVSYGDIAEDAGHPGRSRLVGHLLASTTEEVPWWRVVTSSGRLVPGAEKEQRQRLLAEGVTVANGHVRRAPIGRFRSRQTRP